MNIFKLKIFSLIPNLKHGFTCRKDDLNLKFSDNSSENILSNRKKISEIMGFKLENLTCGEQVHGDNIKIIDKEDIGKGSTLENSPIKSTDGLITNFVGVPLMIMVADCVPVLLCDPIKKIIANLHCGWRGTSLEIVIKALKIIKKNYKSNISDILVGIGPGIGECCYEIGKEVFEKLSPVVTEKNTAFKINNKIKANLQEINKQQCIKYGILEKNIEILNLCTSCNNDLFFSYRKGDLIQRQASIIFWNQ